MEERYNYVFEQYDGDEFIFDLKEDEKIYDLSQCAHILNKYETKLEESDEYRELLLKEKAGYLDLISGYADKCNELKQQLAEKDEIIDWQNEIVDGVKQEEELLAQKLKSLGVDCIEDLGKSQNQTAIAELEKVKDAITYGVEVWTSIDDWGDKIVKYSDLLNFINQQINLLKGETRC